MRTDGGRMIFGWYARYDLFAQMLGCVSVLSRDWFHVYEQYYTQKSHQNPSIFKFKIESNVAAHRVIAMDMTLLFADFRSGTIDEKIFLKKAQTISEQIESRKQYLDPELTDTKVDHNDDDSVDTKGSHQDESPDLKELWTVNFMRMSWHSLHVIHQYQTEKSLGKSFSSDLSHLILTQCQALETTWLAFSSDSILNIQASLGLASVILSEDDRSMIWYQREAKLNKGLKYVLYSVILITEALEFITNITSWIYLSQFNERITKFSDNISLPNWWFLNHEIEDLPLMIQSIYTFVKERVQKS